MDLVEVISFLFMLSTMELGRVRDFYLGVYHSSFISGHTRNIRRRA